MRKNYFLIVITALFTMALFTACKKDGGSNNSSNDDYYVSFKRDGIDIKMTAVAQFALYDSLGANLDACDIAAGTTDGNQALIIDLYDTKSIAAGNTYTQNYLPGTGLSQAQLAYTDQTGIAYASASTLLNPSAQAIVTISELTNTYMKGTFSCKLLTTDYNGIKYTITDGFFYVKRIY